MLDPLPVAGNVVPEIVAVGIDFAVPLVRPAGLGADVTATDAPMPTEPLVFCEGVARGADGFDYYWEIWTTRFFLEQFASPDSEEPAVIADLSVLGTAASPAVVRRGYGNTLVVVPSPTFDTAVVDRICKLVGEERNLVFTRRRLEYDEFLDYTGVPDFEGNTGTLFLQESPIRGVEVSEASLVFEISADLAVEPSRVVTSASERPDSPAKARISLLCNRALDLPKSPANDVVARPRAGHRPHRPARSGRPRSQLGRPSLHDARRMGLGRN